MSTFHPTGTTLLLLAASLTAQVPNLNKSFAAEIRSQFPAVSHPDLDAFCRAAAERLLPGSAISLEIIRSDSAEPAPLPGGPIFVPTRLFLAARTEAEFTAVLAHALVHATQSRRQNGGWYLVPHTDSELLLPRAYQATRQEIELATDRQAIELSQRAGFPTAALGEYLRRVLPSNSPRLAKLPPPENYIATPDERFLQIQTLVKSLLPVRRPPTLHRQPSAKLE